MLQVPSISALALHKLIGETGLDMSAWKSSKHFTSWLGLSPNHKITGGKVFQNKTNKVQSQAAATFRMCAATLRQSDTYLGAFYRKKKAQIGSAKALTATARKIAVIYYTMMRDKKPYEELGAKYFDENFRDRAITRLKKQAEKLGYSVVAV